MDENISGMEVLFQVENKKKVKVECLKMNLKPTPN